MRRNDKEITDPSVIEDILSGNNLCRIAFLNKGEPYLVPMNYGYAGERIYLHSALRGMKLDCMRADNRVCFEISDSIEMVHAESACDFGMRYRSLIGRGRISIIEDDGEKKAGLQVLAKQATGAPGWTITRERMDAVAVLKIEIDSITGKVSGL